MTQEELNKEAEEYSFNIPTQCEADIVWKRETEQHFKDGVKYAVTELLAWARRKYEEYYKSAADDPVRWGQCNAIKQLIDKLEKTK